MLRKLTVCLLVVLLVGCLPPRLDPTMVSAPQSDSSVDSKG
ncbi:MULTISPECIES: hypothetical protein [Lysobacter]|nr:MULTISPECIES: hypothetical protein [Lysobacter]